jgi:hypothetical protein
MMVSSSSTPQRCTVRARTAGPGGPQGHGPAGVRGGQDPEDQAPQEEA